MTLRAKWKKSEAEKTESTPVEPTKQEGTPGKKDNWNYKEIQKKEKTAKTGEKSKAVWGILSILGGMGILYGLRKKRRTV